MDTPGCWGREGTLCTLGQAGLVRGDQAFITTASSSVAFIPGQALVQAHYMGSFNPRQPHVDPTKVGAGGGLLPSCLQSLRAKLHTGEGWLAGGLAGCEEAEGQSQARTPSLSE